MLMTIPTKRKSSNSATMRIQKPARGSAAVTGCAAGGTAAAALAAAVLAPAPRPAPALAAALAPALAPGAAASLGAVPAAVPADDVENAGPCAAAAPDGGTSPARAEAGRGGTVEKPGPSLAARFARNARIKV